MKVSKRVDAVLPSATLAMTARAQALKAQGRDVLTLSAGEPDFDTPEHVKAAAVEALKKGDTKYTPVAGTRALRQAVARWAGKLYGQEYAAEEVIIGTGGKQVLFNAVSTLLDPGDEALFGSPFWVSYPDMIRYAGAKPVPVAATAADGFLPQAEAIRAAITPQTRLIILNSPSNPTGAAYTKEQLLAIADVLRGAENVAIITDDIYSGLTYDAPFVGLAQLAPDLRPRILIATGVSKTYAMTGWRIGFGIGPKKLIAAMTDLQGVATSGACSVAQAAAVAAVEGDQAPVESMRRTFHARRDRLVRGLKSIDGLEVFVPQGAFYVFVGIGRWVPTIKPNSDALCEHLLEKAGLALVPGSAFGDDGYVRLSFACSEQQIDDAVARLKAGLGAL